MKAIVDTTKVVLVTAFLSAAVAGCDRPASDQASGTTGTPESATAPENTATAPGSTTTAPDTASGTGAADSGTAGSARGTTDATGSSTDPSTGTSGAASGTGAPTETSPGAGETPGSNAEQPSSSTSGTSGAGADTSGASSSAGTMIDDGVITTKVKAALLADSTISGMDINVETRQGEVMLSGFVNDKAQVDKAVQVASAVDGVKKVNNKMTVKK